MTAPSSRPSPWTGRPWLLLILLSVLWGGSFFFSSAALREMPPFTVVLVRVV